MSLSTTQYGYIVDPMVPFTDDKGKTIKNGFIRVFMAGTSTPVLTYRNYDGATNQEKIELDNSGRVKHNVIGSKGSLYKVVVYNILHSQENPLLTVDKIAVLGANVTGTTVVTGIDSVTVQEENFLKATVEGTEVEIAIDPTEVTSEVSTIANAVTAAPDYVVPLLEKTGTEDSKKISLANLFKFALDWISRLSTTITSFASGDFFVVSNTTDGSRKMSKDTLLNLTAQNALGSIKNLATTKYKGFVALDDADGPGKMDMDTIFNNFGGKFEDNVTAAKSGKWYMHNGSLYKAKEDYTGVWDASKFTKGDADTLVIQRVFSSHCLPKSIIKGKYINSAGSLANGVNFNVYVYEVPEGKSISFMTAQGGGYNKFTSENETIVGSAFTKGNHYTMDFYLDKEVPTGASLLWLTCAVSSGGEPIVSLCNSGSYDVQLSQKLKSYENLKSAFYPLFDTTKSYMAGQRIFYEDGLLYVFKSNHSAGAWNPSEVDRVYLDTVKMVSGYYYNVVNNTSINVSPTENSWYNCIKLKVYPGQRFVISSYSASVARLWATYDKYGSRKRMANEGTDSRNAPVVLDIQDGEYGLILNTYGTEGFVLLDGPANLTSVSNFIMPEFSVADYSIKTSILPTSVLKNKYVSANGSILNDANFDVFVYDVRGNDSLVLITATGGGEIGFFDASDNLIGSTFNTGGSHWYDEKTDYNISVPADAVTLKMTCYHGARDGFVQSPAVKGKDGYGDLKTTSLIKPLFGKKILAIGDSITEGATWFSSLKRETLAEKIWNRGVGGCTIAKVATDTVSFCDRVDLDASTSESVLAGFPPSSNVDFVIAWGGTNDFGYTQKNVPFGTTLERDPTTFIGAVFYFLDKLKTKYPTQPIYMCGIMNSQKPGIGSWNRFVVSSGVYTEQTNWTGKTVSEYNDAIKKVCGMVGVKYVDMFECGISPVVNYDYEHYFADGLHPNAAGGEIIGKYIARFLNS